MSISITNYPEEYKNWKVTFFGRDFVVTPNVLIPRLETEWLVRRARTILKKDPNTLVVDIGAGSGIMGTSIADLADELIFLDISSEALKIAEKNFRTHFPKKKVQFIVSDLLSNLPICQSTNLLFLANLPYIKDDDWENMSEDTRHEPKLALFWGEETGFELYEKLFEQVQSITLNNSQTLTLIIEFWFDQRQVAENTMKQYPNWKYEFFTDYANIERFCEIHI